MRPCLIFIAVISHMLIMDDFFSVNVAGDNFSKLHNFSFYMVRTHFSWNRLLFFCYCDYNTFYFLVSIILSIDLALTVNGVLLIIFFFAFYHF